MEMSAVSENNGLEDRARGWGRPREVLLKCSVTFDRSSSLNLSFLIRDMGDVWNRRHLKLLFTEITDFEVTQMTLAIFAKSAF